MTGELFIINKLSEFVQKFPEGRALYEYQKGDNSHYIVVQPESFYTGCDAYIEWEESFVNSFSQTFPQEFICVADAFHYSNLTPTFDTDLFKTKVPSTFGKPTFNMSPVEKQVEDILTISETPSFRSCGGTTLLIVGLTHLITESKISVGNTTYAMAA